MKIRYDHDESMNQLINDVSGFVGYPCSNYTQKVSFIIQADMIYLMCGSDTSCYVYPFLFLFIIHSNPSSFNLLVRSSVIAPSLKLCLCLLTHDPSLNVLGTLVLPFSSLYATSSSKYFSHCRSLWTPCHSKQISFRLLIRSSDSSPFLNSSRVS